MTSVRPGWGSVILLSVLLGACSSSTTSSPDLAPAEPAVSEPVEVLPPGPLTAAQISKALGERTFSYAGPGRTGSITYYSDGTFTYQESGKGEGTGLWQASDGKLCEARNPAPFLAKGTPSACSPFSSDGTIYSAGSMRLTPT